MRFRGHVHPGRYSTRSEVQREYTTEIHNYHARNEEKFSRQTALKTKFRPRTTGRLGVDFGVRIYRAICHDILEFLSLPRVAIEGLSVFLCDFLQHLDV